MIMKRILKNISTSAFALFAMLALSCTDDDFYPVETHTVLIQLCVLRETIL